MITLEKLASNYGDPVDVVVDVMNDHGPIAAEPYTAESLVDPNDEYVLIVMEQYIPEAMHCLSQLPDDLVPF